MSRDYKQLILWQKADFIYQRYIEVFHKEPHPKTHPYHVPLNAGRTLAKQLPQLVRRMVEVKRWNEKHEYLRLAIECLRQLENVFDEELSFIFDEFCEEFPPYFRELRPLLLEMSDAVEMRMLDS